jgi:hypothetical protein
MNKIENQLNPGEIAYFHDQKNGDVNSDTGELYGLTSPEYAARTSFYEKDRREKEKNEKGAESPEKNLKKVVELVDNAELEDTCRDNEEQKQLLQRKKEIVKEMLEETAQFIAIYSDVVTRFINPEIGSPDGKQTIITHTDRMKAHDNLLESLEYLTKFLKNNFGLMNDEQLGAFKSSEARNNRHVALIKRFKVPKNGIMPDNLNFDDRTEVANWAFDIYGELQRVVDEDLQKKEGE